MIIMNKSVLWVLRIAVFGEFLGHGVFALQGKKAWIGWIQDLLNVDSVLAGKLLLAIGILDVTVAVLVLLRPIRIALLWAIVWGFWTALLRPVVGEPFWDFVERWANWGAPLALFLLRGWPKNLKEWFR
ncbi:hypothetical protein HYT45_03455 [Candidatus Uhrbacteria bacterium]|nr:hypothetical protein [Candidatus Uhrbacteria bacterium]